jgi:hypothetical protein
MFVPINVKSLNNVSEWQMGFNSAFKGLIHRPITFRSELMWSTTATELEASHLLSALLLARGSSEWLDMSRGDHKNLQWKGRNNGGVEP